MLQYSIQDHYQNLAKQYNDFWGTSTDFIEFLTEKIIEHLHLKSTDVLVDLGCGTGLYSQAIVAKINLEHSIICVDPSDKMLEKIPDNSHYQTVVKDAVEFAHESGQYDKILIKEMIHHIEEKERLLQGLFNRLNKEGILLIILLPPTIEYPLFQQALSVYESVQPHYNDLVNLCEKVGFKTTVDFIDYAVSIPKAQYFNMVKNRYMSLLSRFNDEEINKGLTEMTEKYANVSNLEFCDRFVFLSLVV
ncbi:class I SAM-dependent DNA methyltransferase [Crocosphaera sp.]|uniref:class I SAM-dependent DNA methyltransferase n=1 Tax=Crocosphaera sp. TaxID=2729996 RepID=UPI003F29B4CC|nr:class I SAM-dependent methyltransferase [Crocosphaera sp.]